MTNAAKVKAIREVYSVENNELGHEWSELHVYVHPTNGLRFAINTGSGCSCDYYVMPTVDDLRALEPLTMVDARNRIASWLADERFTPDGKARELERAHIALRVRGSAR